jgi:hypothetical protein
MTQCTKCLISKAVECFYRNKTTKTGYTSWCKSCYKEKSEKWRIDNRAHWISFERTLKRRFDVAKKKSRYRGLKWDISLNTYKFLIDSDCLYCCGALGTTKITGIGLDRIDNDLGYIMGNIVPCCGVCNTIKSDNLTFEETLAAVTAVIAFRSKAA